MFREFQSWKFWIFLNIVQDRIMLYHKGTVSFQPLSRIRIAILCVFWNSKDFYYSCLISMNKAHLIRYIFCFMYVLGGW